MHKFSSEKLKKLDSPQRRKMLPPHELVPLLKIDETAIIADIGCGIGYFTIPLAVAAKKGHVYALDISEIMLAEARRRAEEQALHNITFLQSAENKLPLENGRVDLAFMAMVLHEVKQPLEFLSEVRRTLVPGGRLTILEWVKEEMEAGPPKGERLSEKETESFLAASGFSVEGYERFKDFFYLLFAKKE